MIGMAKSCPHKPFVGFVALWARGSKNLVVRRQLTLPFIAVSLGVMLGSWASGVWGLFLWLTRSHRRVRNMLVIGLGYIVIGISSLGSLLVFLGTLERMEIRRGTIPDNVAMCAFTVSFAFVAGSALRSEFRWRRSVGLGDTTVKW